MSNTVPNGNNDLFAVNGLVAVITGGGSGIGFMIAKALAENGAAKVYIVGRNGDRLNEAARDYQKYVDRECLPGQSNVELTDSSMIALPGDVTSQPGLKRMAEQVTSETGYINLLVANAGKTGPGLEKLKPRHSVSEFVEHAWQSPMEDFDDVYKLNCTAVYYTTLAFLELLDEGNKRPYPIKSQVIATASTASFLRNPRAGYAYCSSKAAVVSMMKCFSTFCVPFGIRFNTIAAGCTYEKLAVGTSD